MREMKDSGIDWIGEIPKDWVIIKLKYISQFINGYSFDSKDLKVDGIYPVIRIGDIKNNTIDTKSSLRIANNMNLNEYRIQKNDILIAMSGATVGKSALIAEDEQAYINQRVGIIRSIYNKYISYSIKTNDFMEYIFANNLSSAQQNISQTLIGDFNIAVPNNDYEYESIVKVLDTKCSEIDSLVEDINSEIKTLEECKKAVITEAVTKGLNPDAEMKNSGIEWIGEIPKDWEVIKGKYVLKLLKRPITEKDTVITCFRDGEVTLRSNRREDGFTMSDKEIGYQGVNTGDLVVHGMDGFAGAIGISDSRGKASPVLNVLDSNLNKKYVMYYLRSLAFNNIFTALSTGIRVRSCDLRWNKLADLFYTVPPANVQNEIANFIDNKCSEIDSTIELKKKQVETLAKYKKSLIYEYVTGKKEVI